MPGYASLLSPEVKCSQQPHSLGVLNFLQPCDKFNKWEWGTAITFIKYIIKCRIFAFQFFFHWTHNSTYVKHENLISLIKLKIPLFVSLLLKASVVFVTGFPSDVPTGRATLWSTLTFERCSSQYMTQVIVSLIWSLGNSCTNIIWGNHCTLDHSCTYMASWSFLH